MILEPRRNRERRTLLFLPGREERTVLKKIHLKRNARDRLAFCGVWPDQSFVLMATLSSQSAGAVCQNCVGVANDALARKDGGTAVAQEAAAGLGSGTA